MGLSHLRRLPRPIPAGGLGPLPRGGLSIAACPTKNLNYAIHDPQIPCGAIRFPEETVLARIRGGLVYRPDYGPGNPGLFGAGLLHPLRLHAVSYTHLTLPRIERCRSRW